MERELSIKIYWEKVNQEFEFHKKAFEKTYNRSDNKTRLLSIEISNYEKLFFPERLPLRQINNIDTPIDGLKFRPFEIQIIRELYQNLIVKGIREYHLTEIPGGDAFHVKVEALSKYLDWLTQLNNRGNLKVDLDRSSKKFYTPEEFKCLTNGLLSIEGFRVNDFLEYHYNQSVEDRFNWPLALRKFLLIDMKYIEPKNIGKIGFAIEAGNKTPEQINRAFLWIRNSTTSQVNDINKRSNPEFRAAKTYSKVDYKKICEKLVTVEEDQKKSNHETSKDLLEFQENYRKLLVIRKEEYEQNLITIKKQRPTIRQTVLGYYYNGKVILKERRHEIAKIYSYKGDPLYNTYLEILDDNNRQKGTRQNIKDLRKVIHNLKGMAKIRAGEDLKEAEDNFDKSSNR